MNSLVSIYALAIAVAARAGKRLQALAHVLVTDQETTPTNRLALALGGVVR